jgi:transcriptional regulator with XRE-family HTH domain
METDFELEQERFILDATEMICELMIEAGVSKSELAARLGKTKGFVTQLLSGNRNFTLRTLSDVLVALGSRALPGSMPTGVEYSKYLAGRSAGCVWSQVALDAHADVEQGRVIPFRRTQGPSIVWNSRDIADEYDCEKAS